MSRPTQLAVILCLAGVLTACGPRGQAATAAGIDADHNGIRDDVDAVIVKEFQESPAQTIYAQRLAKVMQIAATTKNPTRAQAIDIMKRELLELGCLRFNTPQALRSRASVMIADKTYNTPERRRNDTGIGFAVGPYGFVGTREGDYKL